MASLRGRRDPLLVRGMLGLGDNLHQRAVICQLMAASRCLARVLLGCAVLRLGRAGAEGNPRSPRPPDAGKECEA